MTPRNQASSRNHQRSHPSSARPVACQSHAASKERGRKGRKSTHLSCTSGQPTASHLSCTSGQSPVSQGGMRLAREVARRSCCSRNLRHGRTFLETCALISSMPLGDAVSALPLINPPAAVIRVYAQKKRACVNESRFCPSQPTRHPNKERGRRENSLAG